MWYGVTVVGGRIREVACRVARATAAAALALSVLPLSCATRGQSQPGDRDGSTVGDATSPETAIGNDDAARDATSSTPMDSGGVGAEDALVSAGDQEGGGEVVMTGDDAGAPPIVDAGPEAEASADGEAFGEGGPADGAASDGGPGDAAASDSGSVDASPCGTCSTGFQCGAGNYCVTPTGVPAFGRVFVIVLGNQPLSAIQGSASAPYLNGLIATYPFSINYTTTDHPSLPNYIELTSGNTQSVACDCKPGRPATCNAFVCSVYANACACPQSVSNLGDALDTANLRWREYAESMGAPCSPGGVDGGAHFAVDHVPFLYYDDVLTNHARCEDEVRDYADFAADLVGGTIRFAFVTPNLCHDMHDNCGADPVKQGDQWLSTEVPAILATPGFAPGGSDVLFIVGDQQADVPLTSAPLPLIVVSPLAKRGPTNAAYNHHSLLATIEDGLGVGRLGSSQAGPISDVWK